MKEETEIAKINLQNANMILDIYDNPVVKVVLGTISGGLNVMGAFTEGIEKILQKRQKDKERALLEAVFSDESITLDDLNDDFIFEFAMTYNAVMHLLQNEKIIYFANLLRNTVQNADRNSDTFQESIERLCSLSYREIEMLIMLYNCQKEYCENNLEMQNNNKYIQSTQEIWKSFLGCASEKYSLSEDVIKSIFCGLERTGFCDVVNVLYPGATDQCYRISRYFKDFCHDITFRPENDN